MFLISFRDCFEVSNEVEMFFEEEYEIISATECSRFNGSQLKLDNSASHIASFVGAIKSVLKSKNFKKEYFKRRKLYLCEAYCLLWQHSGTGNLDVKKSSQQIKTGAYAAILLDLYACNKINLTEKDDNDFKTQLYVEVIDPDPTFTFMDRVVYNQILQHYEQSGGRACVIEDWLSTAEDVCCVTASLNNLVSRGILSHAQTGVFGTFHKHPLVNIGPVQELQRELKGVALKERRPDSFMLALITMSLAAEDYYSFVDPILESHFTKKEYRVAKENIKMIVNTQGVVLKSPKFTRKKFSVEVPRCKHTSMYANQSSLSPVISSPSSNDDQFFLT